MGQPILRGDFRPFVHVTDLDEALRFYRDILGLEVERRSDEYVDFPAFSLTTGDDAPLEFHVDDFEEAALRLLDAGVEVRRTASGGQIRDPFGNVLGIHDHKG